MKKKYIYYKKGLNIVCIEDVDLTCTPLKNKTIQCFKLVEMQQVSTTHINLLLLIHKSLVNQTSSKNFNKVILLIQFVNKN